MALHCQAPAPARDHPAGGWVAVLALQDLAPAGADGEAYLCAAERARLDALRGSRRRREWLAARLAAKYLFLSRLELGFPIEDDGWMPRRLSVTARSLAAFPAWMYEAIEIRPAADADGGGPRLLWRGREQPQSLSLSHTRQVACACLADDRIGVDLETAEPRVEAFYRSNYTAAETDWVHRCAGETGLGADWLYTLLWTLKEAALKARALRQRSAWSFAGVDVGGLPAPQEVRRAYRQGRLRERFETFTAVIREPGRATSARVAYMGTHDLILTVLKPSRQAVN